MAEMTSASMPRPALTTNHRSAARPTLMVRSSPARSRSAITRAADFGPRGRPRAPASTLALPDGITAMAGMSSAARTGRPSAAEPSRPLTTSLTVPSPPMQTTTSQSRRVRPVAMAVAWRGCAVNSARRDRPGTARSSATTVRTRESVIDVELGLEISRPRTMLIVMTLW